MRSLLCALSEYIRPYQRIRSTSSARAKADRKRKPTRLYLERLEDRCVLSTLTAINNDNGSTGTGGFTQSETSLVAMGNTVVVGFNDSGSYNINRGKLTGFAYSSDGGNTFTDGGQLPSTTKGDGGHPVLAQNTTSGRIYFSTLDFNTRGTTGVNVFNSDNGGVTWQAPVAGAPGGINAQELWMTVDNFEGSGQGNVYLADINGPTSLSFFKSTNDGASFGPSGGTLLASGGWNTGPVVTVGPDHAVYVFYFDGNTSPWSLKVVKSTNQGASFGAPVTVATLKSTLSSGDLGLTGIPNGTTTPAWLSTKGSPHVAVNPVNGQLYVTYNDAGTKLGDKADIYFTMSSDGGNTWTTAVRVNSDTTTTDQWQPAIAASTDGHRVGIFHYSRQEDPTGNNLFKYYGALGAVSSPLTAASTVTFGTSFAVSNTASPPELGRDSVANSTPIGPFMNEYNQTVATSGYFNVTWSDSHDSLPNGSPRMDPDVYFQKIPNGLAVASSVPAAGALVSSSAHPAQYVVNFLDPVNAPPASVFTVNGQAATGVTMSNGNLTATFTFASDPIPAGSFGSQAMAIAAGAITRQGDNDPIQAFNATFAVTPLTVATATPALTGTPRTLSYVVNLNGPNPLNAATIGTSDLSVSGGVVLSAAKTDSLQATYTIGYLPASGTLTVSMPANAVTDVSGNPNVAFSASYTLDLGTFAGALDPTFGSGGKVIAPFTGSDGMGPIVVQSDGKIVTGQGITTTSGTQNFALVRYNANGSLDTGFGSGGVVSTPVGNGNAVIQGLAIQSDGKIVAVGQAVYAVSGSTSDTAFAVARYNVNGTLDMSFGSGGKVLTNIMTASSKGNSIKPGDDKPNAVAIDASGRIIAAGYSERGSDAETDAFALVRYNTNGSLDTSFGSGGIVVTPNFGNGQDVGNALLIQSDGKIVLAGSNHANATTNVMAVARYLPSGNLDSSFGANGIRTLAPAGSTSTLTFGAVLQNGVIVLSGSSVFGEQANLTLARLTPSGQIDTTFGGAGTGFAISTNMAVGRTIVQAANGILYTTGRVDPTEPTSSGTIDLGVAAFLPNGTPDLTFGTDGVVAIDFGGGDDRGREIALQSDGKIVATGFSNPDGSSAPDSFVVVRLLPSYPQAVTNSFTASQNGSDVTLSISFTDVNPAVTSITVYFYRETTSNGIVEPGSDQQLGSVTATWDGSKWNASLTTSGLAPGVYKFYAQALDNYGVFSDPLAITFTVM